MTKTPSSLLHHPIAPWVGRLVFPVGHRHPDDSASFEVYQAPHPYKRLIHQVVTLRWNAAAATQSYIRSVRRDVQFTGVAKASVANGVVHPTRLDTLKNVGPLESLAAARAKDDVTVILNDPVVMSEQGGDTTLVLSDEPIQVTGTFYKVVTLRKRLDQTGDRFQVQHYNPASQTFDGPTEIIRIPQAPPDRLGIYRATNQDIENSLVNDSGWYVYGTYDPSGSLDPRLLQESGDLESGDLESGDLGMFVAQAIEPRHALSLQPDRVILKAQAGKGYIDFGNWRHTPTKAGTVETVLIDPALVTDGDDDVDHDGTDHTSDGSGTVDEEKRAIAQWKEGDRFILIHLFGGMGGEKRDEKGFLGLVTGHFAYGVATIVRDPLTQELRFDIDYCQVYAHNIAGIVSGTLKRCCYVGDFERGWLGVRPLSDIVVKLDCVTQDYHFGAITLSPFTVFKDQLQVMMARYRVGDGTGASLVDAARCCVQDSNQALYVALERIEDEVRDKPEIQAWLRANPDDPQTLRFRKLQSLGRSLNWKLTPLGIVRRDWKRNANGVAGIQRDSNTLTMIIRALASWRTMLPRRSHDEMAKILLDHGAALWFIRTNQVGGVHPDVIPYAPTTLIGGLRDRN